ncbi:hypothetical protein T484DRAFT_1769198 [Baffinella frigidus]|nr:hypothetical protein T484DRAFT_1769198 [Cryptophyta sp. CCMP2293]
MADPAPEQSGADLLSDLKELMRSPEGEARLRAAFSGVSEISLDAFRAALAKPDLGLPHLPGELTTKELFGMLDVMGSGTLMSDELFEGLAPHPAPAENLAENLAAPAPADPGPERSGGDLLSDLKELMRSSEGEARLRAAFSGVPEISLDAFRAALAKPDLGLPHLPGELTTKELFGMLDVMDSGTLMSDELFEGLAPHPAPAETLATPAPTELAPAAPAAEAASAAPPLEQPAVPAQPPTAPSAAPQEPPAAASSVPAQAGASETAQAPAPPSAAAGAGAATAADGAGGAAAGGAATGGEELKQDGNVDGSGTERSMAALQDVLRNKSNSLLSELREMDANKDGSISSREFCRAIAKLDALGITQDESISSREFCRAIAKLDALGITQVLPKGFMGE